MKEIYSIACIFIWIGFIGAISFMEAWLKFLAPGITTSLGLGIGQLVFSALNKVEIVCLLLVLILGYFSARNDMKPWKNIFFITVVIILSLQTFWLLPVLNERASQIINGIKVPKSKIHFIFIAVEIVKVICLFIFGISRMKKIIHNN